MKFTSAVQPKSLWGKLAKLKPAQVVVIAAILALLVLAGLFLIKYNNSQSEIKRLTANPQEAARAQLSDVVAKVGALTELPKDEIPTLATVADPEKLKGQSFFANAQKGDQALIYTQSRKAYLYRPSTNKLLEIAPLIIGEGNTTNQQPTGQ